MEKFNKKGFTLAELLVVVAIIAVLAAISIPVFTSRVESSREATDVANLRNAYAAAQTECLTDSSFNGGYYLKDGSFETTLDTTKGIEGKATVNGFNMAEPDWDTTIFDYKGDSSTGKYVHVTVSGGKVTKVTFKAAE